MNRTESITLIVTVAMLGTAVATIMLTLNTIESTNTLVNNTNSTLTSLNTQLEILEESLKVQKDLSILNAYSSLGKIELKFECGVTTNAPFLSLKPLILDEKGTQTIVPFQLSVLFNIYGKSANSSENYTLIDEWVRPEFEDNYLYDPYQNVRNVLLLMSPFFEEANKKGYDQIRIETFYFYMPYLTNADISLSSLRADLEPKHLVDYKIDEDGKWEIHTNTPACKFLNN